MYAKRFPAGKTARIAKDSDEHYIQDAEHETPTYISNFCDTEELYDYPKDPHETLFHFLPKLAEKYSTKHMMATRYVEKYVFHPETGLTIPHFGNIQYFTFNEVFQRVKNIGRGIADFTGMKPGDKLCINENTSIEWMLMAQTCYRRQYTIVTVYSTMGFDSVCFSLNETSIETIFVNQTKLDDLIELKKHVPTLKYVIYSKNGNARTVTTPDLNSIQANQRIKEYEEARINKIAQIEAATGCKIISFDEIEKMGAEAIAKDNGEEKLALDDKYFDRDNTAIIMYTSGTTGNSKVSFFFSKKTHN